MSRSRHKPKRDTSPRPAWEQPPPPEVLALLDRFPAASGRVLALRHAILFAVSGIALWGIVAKGWTATPLLAYFAAEIALVTVLNFACIAVLPVALTEQDRTVVKAWAWFAWVALLVAIGYGSVEGFAGMRDALAGGARDLGAWLREQQLAWPLACMVAVHVVDLGADIVFWRGKGGPFRYWTGVTVMFRLWFVLAIGAFVALLAYGALQDMEATSRTATIVWLVFLGADLFATWLPIALRRKVQREAHLER